MFRFNVYCKPDIPQGCGAFGLGPLFDDFTESTDRRLADLIDWRQGGWSGIRVSHDGSQGCDALCWPLWRRARCGVEKLVISPGSYSGDHGFESRHRHMDLADIILNSIKAAPPKFVKAPDIAGEILASNIQSADHELALKVTLLVRRWTCVNCGNVFCGDRFYGAVRSCPWDCPFPLMPGTSGTDRDKYIEHLSAPVCSASCHIVVAEEFWRKAEKLRDQRLWIKEMRELLRGVRLGLRNRKHRANREVSR